MLKHVINFTILNKYNVILNTDDLLLKHYTQCTYAQHPYIPETEKIY